MAFNRPFDKLKKQLRKTASVPDSPPPPPQDLRPPTDDELFAEAMSSVQEIAAFRVLPCARTARRPASSGERTDPDEEAVGILMQIAEGRQPINLSHTQEYVEWSNPDYGTGLTEELHAGRFAVQGMLDLHGLTGGEVNDVLDGFLLDALRRSRRCVKIIHGRGLRSVNGPVLKNAVIRRLLGHYRKRIVAFVSARQCDGGLGALYVLLNR